MLQSNFYILIMNVLSITQAKFNYIDDTIPD